MSGGDFLQAGRTVWMKNGIVIRIAEKAWCVDRELSEQKALFYYASKSQPQKQRADLIAYIASIGNVCEPLLTSVPVISSR